MMKSRPMIYQLSESEYNTPEKYLSHQERGFTLQEILSLASFFL
jgi:hypothetical protein